MLQNLNRKLPLTIPAASKSQASSVKSRPTSTAPRSTILSRKEVSLPNKWIELDKNLIICSGSYSQAHKKFKWANQQSAAVCIVACAVATLSSANTWTKLVLDKIVEAGNNLHLKSLHVFRNHSLQHMTPPVIYKYLVLDNLKISMRVGQQCLIERIPRDISFSEKITDLLDEFFSTNTSGIFSWQQKYFAIWKNDKYYFIFDPTEHNSHGGRWSGLPGKGYCCCIRSNSSRFLADVIVKNCPIKEMYKFIIYPCVVKKRVVINTKPPKSLEEAAISDFTGSKKKVL